MGDDSPDPVIPLPRNGANGLRPEGMRTRPIPLGEHQDALEPIDLVAVQADDELISALAAGMSVTAPGLSGYDSDDQVAAVLAAWKAEVDSEPIPELVDVDTAVATVLAARRPSGRARYLVPLAAAAAAIVLAIGGVSIGSYSAGPDDALWAVSKVLYSERAKSVEAAARVEMRITKAKQALVSGQPVLAERELEQAAADLAVIRPEEGKTELAAVQEFLVLKAQETPPGMPTDPGTPLVSDLARPVPDGAAVTVVVPPAAPPPVLPPAGPGSVVAPLPDVVRPDPRLVPPAGVPGPSSAPPSKPVDGSGPPVTGGASPSVTPDSTLDGPTPTTGQSMGVPPPGSGSAGGAAAGSGSPTTS